MFVYSDKQFFSSLTHISWEVYAQQKSINARPIKKNWLAGFCKGIGNMRQRIMPSKP